MDLPIEIIKIISNFLDHDIDFINLIATCSSLYKCSKLRDLTSSYPFSKISKVCNHYTFTQIVYDLETYDDSMKIPQDVHTIVLSEKYNDKLDYFYSHPNLKSIDVGIFYDNIDSLSTIIDTINKKEIIMTIISNIYMKNTFSDGFDILKNDNDLYKGYLKLVSHRSCILVKRKYYTRILDKLNQNNIDSNEIRILKGKYWSHGYCDALIKTNAYPQHMNVLENFNINDKSTYASLIELIKLIIDITNKNLTYIDKLFDLILKKYHLKDRNQYYLQLKTLQDLQNGYLETSSIEDLHRYPKGSCISYKDKNGTYSEKGYLMEFGEDYFEFIIELGYNSENMRCSKGFLDFVKKHTIKINIQDIKKIWIGEITKPKNNFQRKLYVTEVKELPTINEKFRRKEEFYPLIINKKIVHYFGQKSHLKSYKQYMYKRCITWLKLFNSDFLLI